MGQPLKLRVLFQGKPIAGARLAVGPRPRLICVPPAYRPITGRSRPSTDRTLLVSAATRRVGIAVLLEKPGKRAQPLDADHVGFICPDLFVVGYGMDVAHAFRELPFVGVVED